MHSFITPTCIFFLLLFFNIFVQFLHKWETRWLRIGGPSLYYFIFFFSPFFQCLGPNLACGKPPLNKWETPLIVLFLFLRFEVSTLTCHLTGCLYFEPHYVQQEFIKWCAIMGGKCNARRVTSYMHLAS